MSDFNSSNEPTGGEPSYRDAKAQAKAAKAYAKAQRPWYKRKRFIVPGALVAVMMFASLGSGGDEEAVADDTNTTATSDKAEDVEKSGDKDAKDDGGNSSEESKPEEEDAEGPGLNTPVRDGKFEFTVKGVECGKDSIGSDMLGTKAQGQFCLVKLTVENIGDEAQILFGDNQFLYDAEDREFSADTEAAIYLDESNTFIEEINPGNMVDGVLVFDVPADAKPVRMELHDSMFSGGVEVALK